MMKAKETNGAFSISLWALAFFFLIIYKASAYELSLPSDKNQEGQQRCGYSCDKKCPPGSCCNWWGYCGTTEEYCGRRHCQDQCPPPPPPPIAPPPPYAPGQCGMQAGGIKCPPGLCCSLSGWCGATEEYCREGWCQSQCKSNLTPHNNSLMGKRECGYQGCYKKCPPGSCCSRRGWCGTTEEFCTKYFCQDQCVPPPAPAPPPPYAPGRCGMQADGRKCPPGLCCSSSGWCGTTKLYCAKEWCQSQCKSTALTSFVIESLLLNGTVSS
ncbi:Chitin-binding lectin 1 [Capsicum baccatum]|uniref:Chitin-binding lectin 1 n=1 Tax=Capsicum baccatum TaxID=33114 RepID=A0A2G2WQK0_CAPBA|nr:Chitin-binding lectin 1 [Capsicum baccatum]